MKKLILEKPSKNVSMRFSKVLLLFLISVITFSSCSDKSDSKGSKFNGVQIGVINYSYRSMPDQSLESILGYIVQSGISSAELMIGPAEIYAGIPQGAEPDVIREWRKNVSMDKFMEIKKMFNQQGVNIDILHLGTHTWSDEEIDYAFNVCKTFGAIGITMEISEDAAKKMAPFAEKHNLYVIFHNHLQPGNPDFSFEKHLDYGPNLMLNIDIGHYYGATGKDVKLLLEKLHKRIVSIHVKDKTGPSALEPNKNMPFGQGETGVDEVLQLIRDKKWPIICDIELEYEIPVGSDAVKEVTKCLEYCRAALEEK